MAVTINFGDYNMNDYIKEDNYYIPLNLACILFKTESSQTGSYIYLGDKILQFGSLVVSDDVLMVNEYLRSLGTSWITAEYMQYNYDSLALYLDYNFGLDERESRVTPGKTIKYLEGGAYKAMEKYKDKLLSTDLDASNDALIEFFNTDLDDGGHTLYASSNIFGTKKFTRLEVSGPETKNTLNTDSEIEAARKTKGIDAHTVLGVDETVALNGYYKEYNEGTTAYIQFDEFTTTGDAYNPETITADTYPSDSVTLFYYANQQIQNNPNIKDVVIDLSANGGGTIYAEEYISSWVCGGTSGVYRNTLTNSMLQYHIDADVNFDGVFDEKDYLNKDINVYVMISNGSFSCGNKLPCNIADNRKENTYFIGSRSGGGTCAVGSSPINYVGGLPRYSSINQIGRLGSTQDNFTSTESGVEAEFYTFNNTDYDKFTDLDTIMAKVKANRASN